MFDFLQPSFNVGEGVSTGDVIHHDYAMRPPVICARYRPEPLLASRVPYLQFYPLSVDDDSSNFEIDAYRRYVTAGKRVVGKPQQQRTLADT